MQQTPLPQQMMWEPLQSNIGRLRSLANSRYNANLGADYKDLWQWSVDHRSEFWTLVWEMGGVVASVPAEKVVDESAPLFPPPEWFPGARLNYAENLLKFNDDRPAIIFKGELQSATTVTYAELRTQVQEAASAMRACGIKVGDRLAGYISNGVDAVVFALAAASIGAIWSSTSPDFGVQAVVDRFSQIQPRILFSVNAVNYNNKTHDHTQKLADVVAKMPELERVVMIPFVPSAPVDFARVGDKCISKDAFLALGKRNGVSEPLVFEQLPFNHPLYVMYSSGTTGIPKCIVHSAGGTLVQHTKEHLLNGDMSRDDVLFYYTTTGWMMWNWLVGALAIGATIVAYDGSPFAPRNEAMWDLVDEFDITIFGTSAKYISECELRKLTPRTTHKLSKLRAILSTGSPLIDTSFDYVYRDIKANVLLGSITGGTDIISCFAGSNPTTPVYRGQLQTRNLGMAVYCWDESGKEVWDSQGDLVCLKAFPSQPIYFWNDKDNAKYCKAYFTTYGPTVWHHGDYMILDSRTGGIVMLGRSDAVLNPSGVRFGTGDIYSVTSTIDGIEDSVVAPLRSEGDEQVILFLKLKQGVDLTPDFVTKVKSQIRSERSARHVPAAVLAVSDIPHTHNGKKAEIAVRKALNGEEVKNLHVLSNPKCLDEYRDRPEILSLK